MKLFLITAVYASSIYDSVTHNWVGVPASAKTQGWSLNGLFYAEISQKGDTPFLVVKTSVSKKEPLINGNIVQSFVQF